MSKKKSTLETVTIPEFCPEEMPLSCTWIIIGPPASGKCLAKDTLVMMNTGELKKVQDIKIGEKIMGDDSQPRNILSTTSGVDKMYRITPSKGEPYVVNEPHILCLKDQNHKTIEITAGDYFRQARQYKGYRVPVTFSYRKLEEDPYQKGVAFGRFISNKSKDEIYLEHRDDFLRYAINGVQTRSFFLAGLLDSFYEIETDYSYAFGNDFLFLARSLGFDCWIDKSRSEIRIRGPFSRLPLKVCSIKDDYVDLEYDFTIEYIGHGDYYGFEIDGNKRFLLGDFTVTHNTSLMENFAYHRKHVYPTGRVFIATEDGYKRFCKIFHPLYVSNYWDEKEEEKHVLRQRTCEMENGRGYEGNYAINIIDDASDDPKIYKTKLMRGLFKLGSQHWAQLLMIGSQYAIDMPPDIRKSVSYVALGREPEMNERKKLYENFGGLAGSFDRFCDLMDQITGDYTFLIFKKRSQSNKLEECVSWYRTTKLKDWKFGSKEYHAHANSRYDINYVEKIEM